MSTTTKEPKRDDPVNWYDPRQLLRTGAEVAVTTLLGKRADSRRVSALGEEEPLFNAPASAEPELWVDFAADTGDGFYATFAVAQALAGAVQVSAGNGIVTLPGGQVLVLGGDQVYPTPSEDAYERRFLAPFHHAQPAGANAGGERHMFAIPGNHDWYDGLIEFTRVFTEHEQIGPWRTQQNRSYFALRLSPRLCLFGLDTQIYQDIDREQLVYFRKLLERWAKSDDMPRQVIVVTPEPHWEQVDYVTGRTPPLQRVDVYRKKKPILLDKLLNELEQAGFALVLQLQARDPRSRQGRRSAAPLREPRRRPRPRTRSSGRRSRWPRAGRHSLLLSPAAGRFFAAYEGAAS
jgi:hypothetical protein